MTFTDLFIKRPVLAIVVSALVLLMGLQAATRLAVRQFPELERSVITVRAVYPGASARTVQGFVTAPLQRRLADARGVDYLTSESNPGMAWIRVYPKLGTDTGEVLTELIAKLNEARFELPQEVEDPVVGVSMGEDALLYISFHSDEMSNGQVTDYLQRVVQPEMATVDGVGAADVLTSQYLSLRVWLNPARMAAHGVTAVDVNEAIRRENYLSAAGATQGSLVAASVEAATDMQSPGEFANLVVRQEGDRRVLLGEVADIELAEEDDDVSSYSNGSETIYMAIFPAPDANPLEVAAGVRALMPDLNQAMPADLTGVVEVDATMFIDAALFEVGTTLVEAVAIVILVMFLFLGSPRIVLIPLAAIPLSLIGVLLLMYAAGFSINLLTLLAMVIAIGLVVDDAIVVVENVHRYIEAGENPMQAALRGARQVAWPVVSMTLTLAAVYAPIAFLGGLTGVLFLEFAMTLAGAVMVSGLIALSLSPMMCSRLLRDHDHQGRFADWLDRYFSRLRRVYRRALTRSLDNRGATLLFALVIIFSLPLLFQLAQRELAPEEDSGVVFTFGKAPGHTNHDYVARYVAAINAVADSVPEVRVNFLSVEQGGLFGGMLFEDWGERKRRQPEIQREIQSKLAQIPGLEIFTFGRPALPGADAGLPVQFVLSSNRNYREIQAVAEEVLAAARESGLFIFINQSLDYSRPEVTVSIDRDKAASLGVSMAAIGNTLAVMLGEAETNRIAMDGRSYKVIPQASRDFRLSKEWLQRYYVRTEVGELVPLSMLVRLGNRVEPVSLSQYQQLNSTTLQGMVMPPHTLGDALTYLQRQTRELAPPDFRIGYLGESLRYQQESQSFLPLFAVSLLVIYLVLAAQFNGFRDPFIVLLGVPMSIFGALVPLALGWVSLNIYTQVGLLTLIGLISKHGILIVEFANNLVAEGRSRRDAVLEAASLRLRPILMTTFATVLGVLPLLVVSGAGANSRFSIGLMIAAGMLVGTLFTLFVVPAFYLPLQRQPRGQSARAGSAPPRPHHGGR